MENDGQAPTPQFQPRKSHKYLAISLVAALLLIGGALVLKTTLAAKNETNGKAVLTTTKLAAFDGKSGRECYVAVDDTVYKIEQGRLWQNGTHTSSEGEAGCGRDLSNVIGKSPHGRSKLSTLEVVGTLQN